MNYEHSLKYLEIPHFKSVTRDYHNYHTFFPHNFQCYDASQVTVSTFLTDDWLTLQVNVSVSERENAVSVMKLLIYDVIKVELNQSSLLFLYWLVGILSS